MSARASMNHIYRLIWSDVLGAWIAVAEHARGRGKRSGGALLAPALLALGVGVGAQAAPPPAPTALPTGATVVGGSAAVSQNSASMTIRQTSLRGAIDWQSFNVGAQAKVNFVQPSRDAVTLNRVLDTQGSQIFGKITANGQVFLSNPNGVYFSPSAVVDVGALVATTHTMSVADFMAGKSSFTRAGATGSVVNEGKLTADIGGYIALLAPEVRNQGVVFAQAGTVALAAGESFELQFADSHTLASVLVAPSTMAALVENRHAVLAPGGLIILSAQASNRLQGGVINNSGSLEADGIHNDGGRILLGASDRISHSGTIHADAAPGSSGKGGTVTLIADLANAASVASVDGTISVRGGALGGDGGFVETSGSHLKIGTGARVDARATAGKSGQWLLDPDGFTIAASGGDIDGTTLSDNLALADVAILSTGGTGSGGHIAVNDAVSWSANKLTLTATNDININAVMTASGSASLDLEPGSFKVNTAFGPNNTFKGKVNFKGCGVLTISGHVYRVIDSLGSDRNDLTPGTLQGAQLSQNEYYALGTDIDASATAGWNNGFTPFGVSWGAFDGLGHTITALTIKQSGPAFITSLYGNTSVQLRNLGLVGGTVERGTNAAGIVGINYGTISNAFSTMTVTGFNEMGGLVGDNRAGIIRNSYATGDVSGTSQVGGLVGKNTGIIENSYATGNVTGTTAFIGGLAGLNYFGTIRSSYATGNVTGSQSVGGLVGINQAAGGAGSNIINTYAMGAVSGNTNVGGLVGENGGAITNSYAVGAVTMLSANTSVGGLVGLETYDGETTTSVVNNSFWDTQTSGQATSAGGTGMTTAEMKTRATFGGAGWDFATPVWQIKASANHGYPCLAVFASCPSSILLSVRLNASRASNVYGDEVGTFSYALYSGNSLIDAAWATDLGISVGGSMALGDAPSLGSHAGAYHVVYASGLTLGGANADNYDFAPYTGLAYTVLKRPLLLTGSRAYDGGTAVGAAVIGASNLVGNDCAAGLAACGLTGNGSVASKNVSAGSQALALGGLELGGAVDGNYTLTGASGAATITQRALELIATATNRTYNGTRNAIVGLDDNRLGYDELTATYSGASFDNKNAGTGKTVTVAGITLSGADAGNYSVASSTTTLANITPRALELVAHSFGRKYNGGTAATVTFSADDSVVAGDDLAATYSAASFLDKNVGTAKTINVTGIALGGADAGNYNANTTASTTANITKRPLDIFASALGRVYNGGTVASATLTLDDSVVFGDVLTKSYGAANFANKNAGAGKAVLVTGIMLAGADAGNYSYNTTANTTATITARPLTVFASAASRTYNGGTAATVTLTADDSVVFGDILTLSNNAANFADKNVGKGKAVTVTGIALGGADAGNYTPNTTANALASINRRALEIFASGVNRTYDGGTAATVTLLADDSMVSGDALTMNYSEASFLNKNAGTSKAVNVAGITLSGADAGNYKANTTANTSADITQRPLTVFATALSRVYDGGTAASATLTPDDSIVSGDLLTVSNSAANFTDKNAGIAKTVNVTGITVGGADAGNYSLASNVATTSASITPRLLLVSASGTNRVYDGATGDAITLADDRIAGDVLTLGGSGAFADKNVGNGKTVSVTDIVVGGADAGNYIASATTATTTANITPRGLNVGAIGIDRVFDGGVADNVTLTDDRLAGDSLALANGAADFVNAQAGVDKLVNVTGISVGGADGGNYSLLNTSTTATATVTPGPVPDNLAVPEVPRPPVVVPVVAAATTVASPLTLSATPARGDVPAKGAVTVTLVRAASATSGGAIAVSIPKEMVTSGASFSFPLPAPVTEALAVGGATVRITQMDDTPLPAWLKYVTGSQTFDVSSAPAGTLPFEVRITVDGQRWTLVLAEGGGK
jgi:filamentous hemagglutinin family protein